ncbi:MAG: SPOR domain-containing protein [Acidiferrobacterales bacterium]|jgi:DedD protein|nr:SPOR domain-containing protein [Acidiferrobacterales bacterium]
MATQENDNDFEPRHRILGAVVLVSLAFILFSVVLHEQPQLLGPDDKQVAVTPDTKVVVTPVPSPQASTGLKSVPKVVNNPLAPKASISPDTAPAPSSVAPAKPVAKAEPEPKAPSSTATKPNTEKPVVQGNWMVQVGTFSDPANARRLRTKLEAQKYQVSLKVIAIKSGQAVRVRVGPFASRDSATRARDSINTKHGIKGVVLEASS